MDSNRHASEIDAVYTATSCDDGPFPWQSDTPITQRPALLNAAFANPPKNVLGGLGPWAAKVGNASLCLNWPLSPARDATAAAPYPNVPVLAVSGALDLRSPGIEARTVLAHFTHGHLITVTNAGHATLATNPSACLVSAVRSWLRGQSVPRTCHNPRPLMPIAAFPPEGPGRARLPVKPADTLSLVAKTLHEAEATWLVASYEETPNTVAGPHAGRLTVTDTGFTLSGYSISGGVGLSGTLQPDFSDGNPSLRLSGIIHVKAGAGTIGTLAVNRDTLDGRLAGKTVVAGRLSSAAASASVGRSGQTWSTWAPPSGSTTNVANAIARHVAAEYRLDDTGTKLLAVSAGPPTSQKRSISALAVRATPGSRDRFDVHLTFGTWTYTLCGAGARCSIATGQPTTTRGRLVRREALEIALYTFKFAPEVSSLLIYVPPPPGAPPSYVLYFERSQLAEQLTQPLDKTLTLANPPLPTEPDNAEERPIDSLTLPHEFNYTVVTLAGSTELLLTPLY
jgi:hypothetical protein